MVEASSSRYVRVRFKGKSSFFFFFPSLLLFLSLFIAFFPLVISAIDEYTEPQTWEEVEEEEQPFDVGVDQSILSVSPLDAANNNKNNETLAATQKKSLDIEDEREFFMDPLGIAGRLNPSEIIRQRDDLWAIFFTQEDFDPDLYLSFVHKDTEYNQLKVCIMIYKGIFGEEMEWVSQQLRYD